MPPICIICGLPIEGRQSHAKYHGGACQREVWRRESERKRKLQGKPAWKKKRPCSECGKVFMPKSPRQGTCGEEVCKYARKKRLEKLRAAGVYQKNEAVNSFGEALIPDPWEPHLEGNVLWPGLDMLPPECRSWYQAEMMPLI